MMPPRDAIAAVVHPDPYAYYAGLRTGPGFYHDEGLGLLVATRAEVVAAVLEDERCRVRPPGEPVPRALVGTHAGEIFGRLVRMNEGERHRPMKAAIAAALDALNPETVALQAQESARRLALDLGGSGGLGAFARRLPVHVIGRLLGVPEEQLGSIEARVDDLVRGFAASGRGESLPECHAAADELLRVFRSPMGDGLVAVLRRQAQALGRSDPDLLAANAIGFLSQGYEATAGLIGNAVVALARSPELRTRLEEQPALLRECLLEVLRFDSPVQNTRRWMQADGVVAGRAMREGDGILLVLAAANRDPAANPDPDRFDLARQGRRLFTFGAARHSCPGQELAVAIAQAGLEQLQAARALPDRLPEPLVYRPSVNTRIPFWQ